MTNHTKSSDGLYHIDGKTYKALFGSRKQVLNQTAYQTTDGLTTSDISMNKWGRIVSANKSKTTKTERRLQKHGFFEKKGKFGAVTRKQGIKMVGYPSTVITAPVVNDDATSDATSDATDIPVVPVVPEQTDGTKKSKKTRSPERYDLVIDGETTKMTGKKSSSNKKKSSSNRK
jgi:hypothetical protein